MSSKLLQLLRRHEQDNILINDTTGGGPSSIAKRKLFLSELNKVIRENNTWLLILFAILILVICFLSVLIWRHQDNQVYFFSLLGGQGLSILFCINRLSHLYNQKRTSELLLHLYADAENDSERAKVVREIIKFLNRKEESVR